MSTALLAFPRARGWKARALAVGLAIGLVMGAAAPAAPAALAQDAGQPAGRAGLTGVAARVVHSADGVPLRAEPSHDADVPTVLPAGAVVALRIDEADTVYDPDGTTRWWPVHADGYDGWVAGFFLEDLSGAASAPSTDNAWDGAAGTDPWADAWSASYAIPEGADLNGLTARVSSLDGVNLRAEPNTSAAVVASVEAGAVVELRVADVWTVYDDAGIQWWPARYWGMDGWIPGTYLAADVTAAGETWTGYDATSGESWTPAASDAGIEAEATTGWTAPAATGVVDASLATAVITSPDGVNLRANPDFGAEVLLPIGAGTVVELRVAEVWTVWDAAGTQWWPARQWGVDGWIAGLVLSSEVPDWTDWSDGTTDGAVAETGEAGQVAEAPAAVWFAPGDYAAALTPSGLGVNIRASAWPDAEHIGYVAEGGVVQVMDGPIWDEVGNRWLLVTDGGVTGYAAADLLIPAAQPAVPAPETEAAPAEVFTPAEEPVVEQPAPDPTPAPVFEPAPAPSGPTGSFIYPTQGTFTQAYGCSPYWFEPYDPGLGCNFHNGIDLANAAYTPIVAADGGTVTAAGWCDCGLGYYVSIDHGNGFETTYGHMAEQPYVFAGQVVTQGQTIGPMGSTGNSTGPHVHFIVKLNGGTVDPLAYLG